MIEKAMAEQKMKVYLKTSNRWALILVLAFSLAGCGYIAKHFKTKTVQTRSIVFICDRKFNSGQRLPIDIVYVPVNENVSSVTKIGPRAWFEEDKRSGWPYKQSLSLFEGAPKSQVVDLKVPAETQAIVIITDYLKLKGPQGEQIVLDAKAKIEETIFVTNKGLLR